MVAVNVVAADDDATARRLFTSRAAVVHERLPRRARPAPAADRRHRAVLVAGGEGAGLARCSRRSYVGSPETVRDGLEGSSPRRGADELIVAAAIHDHAARVRSYEILSEIRGELAAPLTASTSITPA